MKVAIHHRIGSFSDSWIDYCESNRIDYKIVNAFDSDIIEQVNSCDIFMWHHHHNEFKDVLTAKRILFSLEHAGVKVFPDFKTGWHFDDKVAQKYLLEAIDAPLVPSYIFYDKSEALNWLKNTTFPKVFKLKGGAGASNVKLVRNEKQGIKFVKRSFGKGFSQFDRLANFQDTCKKYLAGQVSLVMMIKAIARLFVVTEFAKMQSRERGYIYFQKFIPNNDYDVRVVVINSSVAAAEKRFVRAGDFRASGSGKFSYENIDLTIIKKAFEISKKLGLQVVAFDFIYDGNTPLVVELSYGFGVGGICNVPGYWDKDMKWHKGNFNPQGWIIDSLLGTN